MLNPETTAENKPVVLKMESSKTTLYKFYFTQEQWWVAVLHLANHLFWELTNGAEAHIKLVLDMDISVNGNYLTKAFNHKYYDICINITVQFFCNSNTKIR